MPTMIVFRYGKVTLGNGWIRLQNRTNDTTIQLSPEETERWRKALTLLGALTMEEPSHASN